MAPGGAELPMAAGYTPAGYWPGWGNAPGAGAAGYGGYGGC